MAIVVYLEDVLKKRGMTSKELCQKIHITEANLSILRSGKARGVRFETLNKICYYLECEVGEILKFDGKLDEEENSGSIS
ncbi:MAG: helix-turn-helix transcriptional regulator [Lachnospiraceae bacterium]|nr:helix-turn-helix transcriptional regulator [Lachnospiraceae bacterium]